MQINKTCNKNVTGFRECEPTPQRRQVPLAVGKRNLLAADLRHAAFGAYFVVMLVGLRPQGLGEHGAHRLVVSGAQRGAYVVLVVREQARAQLAVGRQPQSVAFAAEVTRQRADEAHRALRVRELEVARGPPPERAVVAGRHQLVHPRGAGGAR